MTEVKILTLPFDPLLDGFANERLRDLLHGRELVEMSAFPFTYQGRPYWSLCLSTRRLQGSPAEAREEPAGAPAKPSDEREAAFRELLAELSEHERVLYDRLRGWRRDVAKTEGKAAFMIAPNNALLELARRRPRTKAGLVEVKGLGEKKVAAYGDAIIEVLHGSYGSGQARREAPADHPPVEGPDGVVAERARSIIGAQHRGRKCETLARSATAGVLRVRQGRSDAANVSQLRPNAGLIVERAQRTQAFPKHCMGPRSAGQGLSAPP